MFSAEYGWASSKVINLSTVPGKVTTGATVNVTFELLD